MGVSCYNPNLPEITRLDSKFGEGSHKRLSVAISNQKPYLVMSKNGIWKQSELFSQLLKETSDNYEEAGDIYFKTFSDKFTEWHGDNGSVNTMGEPVVVNSDGILVFESQGKQMPVFNRDVAEFEKRNESSKETLKEAAKNNGEAELINDLTKIMSNFGFDIGVLDKVLTSKGIDANGLADINAKLIQIAKGADVKDITEEMSHVIISLATGTPAYKNLYKLASNKEVMKEALGQSYEAYKSEYKNDSHRLTIETMGKLLRDSLISEYNNIENFPEASRTGLKSFLKRVYNYIMNKFKSIDTESYSEQTKKAFNDFAKDIKDGKDVGLSKKNLEDVGPLYSIKYTSQKNFLKKEMSRVMTNMNDRIENYTKQGKIGVVAKEVTILEQMKDEYDKDEFLLSALNFLENTQKKMRRTMKAAIDLQKDNITTYNPKDRAAKIHEMKTFVESYKDVIRDIKTKLNTEYNLSLAEEAETLPDEDKKKAEGDLNLKALLSKSIDIQNNLESINDIYIDLAKPIVAKYLGMFTKNLDINVFELLDTAATDLSTYDNIITAMSISSNDLLQLIDASLRYEKSRGEEETLDTVNQLQKIKEELEDAGIKDTKWMYDGRNFASPVKTYKFNSDRNIARQKIYDTIIERLKGNKIATERPITITESMSMDDIIDIIHSDKKLNKEFGLQMRAWYRANTEQQDTALAKKYRAMVMTQKSERLSSEAYEDWLKNNRTVRATHVYYTGDLATPIASKYKNNKFDEIESNPAKKKAYKAFMTLYNEQVAKTPASTHPKLWLAPQVAKGDLERAIASKNVGSLYKQAKDAAKRTFYRMEDDTEFGDSGQVRKRMKLVPVHFTKEIEDVDALSTDVIYALSGYTSMSNNYKYMSKLSSVLELAKDVISDSGIAETDSNGNRIVSTLETIKNNLMNTATKRRTTDSNISKRLQKYIDMNVYGEQSLAGVDGILGNSEKWARFLAKYSAITSLAFNAQAIIQNPINGFSQINVEAASKQFIDRASVLWAQAELIKAFPDVIKDMFKSKTSRRVLNKMSVYKNYMNVRQEHSIEFKEDSNRRTMFARAITSNSGFILYELGEFFMGMTGSLSLAKKYRFDTNSGKFVHEKEFYKEVKDLERKLNKLALDKDNISKTQYRIEKTSIQSEIKDKKAKLDESWKEMTNWFDAHNAVDGKLELDKKFKISDEDYSMQKMYFIQMQDKMNNLIHGFYNEIDKGVIQQSAITALFLQYRKHLPAGISKRYSKRKNDVMLDSEREGYIVSYKNFVIHLLKQIKQRELDITREWDSLDDVQKRNVMRTHKSMMNYTMMFVLGMIFMGIDWDDDDEGWMANMATYQLLRAQAELGSYALPGEVLKTIKTPFAAVSTLGRLSKILNVANMGKTIKRGTNKGDNQWVHDFFGTTPYLGAIKSSLEPADRIQGLK